MTGGATAIPEVQALLRSLATGRDVAELGAAYGETAALLAGTARSVVTVEADPEPRRGRPRTTARDCERRAARRRCVRAASRPRPFGLVFADGGRPYDWEAILAFTEPGGLIVKDDLTPGRSVEGDAVREFLLRDPRLAAAEILATPAMAVIVASRLR